MISAEVKYKENVIFLDLMKKQQKRDVAKYRNMAASAGKSNKLFPQ